jgi:hypothetical protein
MKALNKRSSYSIVIILFLLFCLFSKGQNVGINTTGASPNQSAGLDVDFPNKGFAMPRLTTAQRIAITNPIEGLQVYDTDLKGFYFYTGITWNSLGVPAGLVSYFANNTAPVGYLECNGQAISRTQYPELFTAIGTLYGSGNGTTTFNIPDLRGEFIRGADNGRGIDSGRTVGTWQSDSIKNHTHPLYTSYLASLTPGGTRMLCDFFGGTEYPIPDSGPRGGKETRPRNVALLPCIKY